MANDLAQLIVNGFFTGFGAAAGTYFATKWVKNVETRATQKIGSIIKFEK